MKLIFEIIMLLAVLVTVFYVSNLIFDAVVNSGLSPFWKWMLLRG